MRSRTVLAVGVALLVVLAGCGGGANVAGGNGAPEAGGSGGGDAASEAEKRTAESSGGGSGDSSTIVTRARIRTGEITLRVQSYDAARSKLTTLAESHGGYVSDSAEQTHSRGNATWTTGHVVLRVPSEDFSAVFSEAKKKGTVRSASTSSKDVTDKLVDINARLENLRVQRDRLRELYEQANDTEDVLRVSEKLTQVQREIERLEAQKRNLKHRVAYATITIELREEKPESEPEPEPKQWYETGVIAAFLESVSGVLTVLRALVVGLAYVAPYALAFGTPVVGLIYLYRRRELS